ncbi:MAG: DegT/DnrJ/EryC1/StrS aminotransferase family protein [Olsenella sp.]|nr:DegT/DnrJ/EryC1/StrS aminotransferase family protein [Olsenella sp.]
MPDVSQLVREDLARRTATRPEDWFLTLKARHAMLIAFQEMRRLAGEGQVVTQLLTCCTAVDPIVAAGLTPHYADVDEKTLSVDAVSVGAARDVRCVVLQHTFGMVSPEADRRLASAAHSLGAVVLEDCAHCVGTISRDPDGEPVADISVHSFGVEKMLPTQFGGAIWLNPAMRDGELRQAIAARLSALTPPDDTLAHAIRTYLDRIRILSRLPKGAARKLRARWEAKGSFEPAVSDAERRGEVSHEPMAPSAWAAERMLAALGSLDESRAQRREAVSAYAELLAGIEGAYVPAPALERPDALLEFPIFLKDDASADAVISALGAAGYYAVPWYRPLLYPGPLDASAYGFDGDLDGLPVTARLSQGPVGLPTDVTLEQVREIVGLVSGVLGERSS